MSTEQASKPGYKTTEMWLALLSTMLPTIGNMLGIVIPTEAIYAIIAYIAQRGWVKGKALGG